MTPTYLRDLRAFVLVAETETMTRVAQILGESSGAVSRRIDRLEREVGLLLVHRSTRAVRLSDEGVAYLSTARQVLDLLDQATERTAQQNAVLSGVLRIWCSPGYGLNVLPTLLARLTELHPGLQPEVTLGDTTPNFALGTDIAIVPATRQLRDSALIRHRIMDWTNIFVASTAYLARRPAPLQPADLDAHLIALGGEQAREQVELTVNMRPGVQECDERFVVRPTTISSDINFVHHSCLAGGGIAFMPTFMVADDLLTGRLVQVLADYASDSYSGSLYCLYRKTRIIPPKIRAFVSALRR